MPASPNSARWTLGFSGHRQLASPRRVAELLAQVFETEKKVAAERGLELAAVSSIASGADTLFAEQALAFGVPWIALLPFEEPEFYHDFGPEDWARARRCLRQAESVQVCSTCEPRADFDTDKRNEAYHRAGIVTVDLADVLVTVWNGQPARGYGGTGDMVEYARQQGKPCTWIHAVDLKVVAAE